MNISSATKKAIIETVKEFLRFMWFGAIALVVTYLQAQISDPDAGINEMLVLVIGLVIRLLDKYVHENRSIKVNGLAPAVLQK